MPRKTAFKCYFGCTPYKGRVHHFPPSEYPYEEKFSQWKMVLNETDIEKGDKYIYNNIHICDHHFEEFYITATGRLTKNAIPTLNIGTHQAVNHGMDLTTCSTERTKISDIADANSGQGTTCEIEPVSENPPVVISQKRVSVKKVILNKKRKMDEVEDFTITDSTGRCKCCLSESELRIMWQKHEFEGEEENYGEMLKECFGISWEPSEMPEMICEVCVSRLREAMDFKLEILTIQEMLQEGVHINIKSEVEQDADSQADCDTEFLESSDDNEPEDVPSNSQSSSPEPQEPNYLLKLRERRRRNKIYSSSDLREALQKVLRGEMSFAEATRVYGVPKATLRNNFNKATKGEIEDTPKNLTHEKHDNLIEDIKKLLTHTNAMPFKTKANRYYCFYCSSSGPSFEDPEDLRQHNKKHQRERITSIEQRMKPQWTNEVIKMDILNLHCTDCRTMLPDWNKMFVHFAKIHSIGFDEAYTKIIPYALTLDFICVLCNDKFHNYGHLDAHMNRHYSNYICYECGDTFLAASRLDKHLFVHKVGKYPCKMCDKVFTLERYRRKHVTLVHKQKRAVKCFYCTEKFVDMLQRHRHVTEVHKEKVKTITCEECGKQFTWRPYFHAHVRKKHKGDKKYKCQYCLKTFLMPYELVNHQVRHTDEKNFVCMCGESFKRVITLRKHYRVAHGDEVMIDSS